MTSPPPSNSKVADNQANFRDVYGGNFHVGPIVESQKDSELALVGIEVEDDLPEFPKVDVKLRNVGGKTAYLKEAFFHVDKIWDLIFSAKPRMVPVSWEYQIDLPLSGEPYNKRIPLSQAIEPNKVDRFEFVVGNDGVVPGGFWTPMFTLLDWN